MIFSCSLAHNIPFFSIFTAMFAGIVGSLIKNGKTARRFHIACIFVIGLMSAVLLVHTLSGVERFTFLMGHFPAPWGNELKAGPLEAILSLSFSVVMILTVIGGEYMIEKDILPEKQSMYFVMLSLVFGAMIALIYTNDLFTGYVFIEINTICSCALIMSKDSGTSILSTIRYLIMSLLGSGMILLAIAFLYTITGHLLFTQLKDSVLHIYITGEYNFPLIITIGLFTLGIGAKSALFPFHTMLPGAYDSATPASSGILSGLVLKSYIIFLVKIYTCIFSMGMISNMHLTNLLFFLGACGMIIGSVLALKERRIRRVLAYSSVAQIGYIYIGIGLGTIVGLTAAMLYMIAHAVTKSMLFICVGRMKDISYGNESSHCLKGIAHKDIVAGIGFTIGALSIVGVPLLAGFAAKLYLALASFYSPMKMAIALIVLAASMVLNAMYFIPPVVDIWRSLKPDDFNFKVNPERRTSFVVSVILFMAVNIFVGTYYDKILDAIEIGLWLMH